MCLKKPVFGFEKKYRNYHSSILLAAALSSNSRIAVQKRRKDNEKCTFDHLHNEMKYVLSIKEANFNEKNVSKFSHLFMVRVEGAAPPRQISKTTKRYPPILLTLLANQKLHSGGIPLKTDPKTVFLALFHNSFQSFLV